MKKTIKLLLVMFALSSTTSFAQEKKASWPEMKTFHSYMAGTFHPAEDGNLVPLRQKSDSLYRAAKAWQSSTVPNSFKAAETTVALKKLVAKCTSIKKAVDAKIDDKALTVMITDAHDIFHHIVGECSKADE